jgi:hypothetical protein
LKANLLDLIGIGNHIVVVVVVIIVIVVMGDSAI